MPVPGLDSIAVMILSFTPFFALSSIGNAPVQGATTQMESSISIHPSSTAPNSQHSKLIITA